MKDFFISYNQADRQWAEWIAWVLEEVGYSTVLQAWDFRPGCNFPLEMHKAIKETERIILVLSQDFLDSDFTAPEWSAVFAQDPTGVKGKILPIRVRDCKPDGLLAPISRIDLIRLNQEEAKRVLLAGIPRERGKPKSQPDFPGPRSVPSKPQFPGELPERGPLPPGYRVPFLPNAVFTGRQEYLTDLADILLHPGKDNAADAGVVVTGIGGVGKSQLAVEFCYRYGRFFQGVHWIQANLNIFAEIAECGLAMGLPGWPDKLPEQVAATIRAWQEGGRRLVVLDSAELLEPLQEWMTKLQPCRLLITSRRDNWPADLGLQIKRLEELTRIHSLELLRKLAPRLQKVADDELGELANHLGNLPLALDLAGRYLAERTELSIRGYLQELEAAGNALEHTSLKDWVEHNPTNHSTSLAATFALSWDQLGDADELARLLFRTGGYCAPNTPIPRQLLAKAIEARGSDQELDRGLRKLESLGLMQTTEGGHRMHTMLAEFARLQDRDTKESALPALADAMIVLTNRAIESGLLERMGPLREHLEVVAQATEEAEANCAGALWSNYGTHLCESADFDSAKIILKKALHIDTKVYGRDHPAVAIDINNLGGILQELGELQEARKCFEKALQIDEKVYGPDHPAVARDINNLGLVLSALGDVKDARKCFEKALLIDEKVYGPEHPLVAIMANNLGSALSELGELQEARKRFLSALQIDEKFYGPDHPNVARDANNLGRVLKELGELLEARKFHEKALQIDEKVFGQDHLSVARDTSNLGGVLEELGELQEARKCIERALQIDEKVYGPGHPKTAIRINNLGVILQDLSELQEARKCFERALQIHEKVYGRDHPEVAKNVNNLGLVLKDLGEFQEARKYVERALQIDEKVYGPDHPNVARDANNLGGVLKELGELLEARKFYERALQIDEKVFGQDHLSVARDTSNLGLLLLEMGESQEARECIERALQIDEKVYGPDHPNVARDANNLGGVLNALGEQQEARMCFERTIRICRQKFGEDHQKTNLVKRNLELLDP